MRRALLLVTALLLGGAEKHSGYDDATPAVRAMQDDDTANPAMLWVGQGEALWNEKAGASGKSCASCHGQPASMRGVATHYPKFAARPVTLTEQINQCRTE